MCDFFFIYFLARISALSGKSDDISIPKNFCENQALTHFYPIVKIVITVRLTMD